MGRPKGIKNRNYPSVTLEECLLVASSIQDGAAGTDVSRLTLAELMDRSPSSSAFRELVFSSRAYGLTTGGINSDEFGLTALGDAATGGDEVAREDARRQAVLSIDPYRLFLTAFNNKKFPASAVFKDWLVKNADVPVERVDECMERIVLDARFTGIIRDVKGADYIELVPTGASTPLAARKPPVVLEEDVDDDRDVDVEDEGIGETVEAGSPVRQRTPAPSEPTVLKKVFIAHGRNRVPLNQLKEMLDRFKVRYAIAVDEANQGRPISAKVAALMRDECSSAIFIFTADEEFEKSGPDGEPQKVWRPSENVVYELGAASVLYDRRIVIFKEKAVTFPSDFSDLGYIEFEKDDLVKEMGALFSELVALDILEVRAKA